MSAENQDGVLARWREDAAKFDPPLYSTREIFGRVYVWMSIIGNVGWYLPEIVNGETVGIRSITVPPYSPDESPAVRAALGYHFQWVNPKQRRKIAALVANHGKPPNASFS